MNKRLDIEVIKKDVKTQFDVSRQLFETAEQLQAILMATNDENARAELLSVLEKIVSESERLVANASAVTDTVAGAQETSAGVFKRR